MYYGNVTFLLCLPRSRSAWLCEFLSPVAITMHDPLKACESIDELGERVDECLTKYPERPVFIGDTAAVLFLPQIMRRFPCARYLIVMRDSWEVEASLKRLGLATDYIIDAGAELACAEDQVTRERCMRHTIMYEDLDRELLNVWRFVGGVTEPIPSYISRIRDKHIEVPLHIQRTKTNWRKVGALFDTRKEKNDAARRLG